MKRVLSLVLMLTLVLSTVMPAFAEEATTTVAEEVSSYTADLAAFGIVEGDGTGFNEAGELTRAATAKILAYFYGENEIAKDFAVDFGFTDMEEDAWYLPWVNYAASKGYMIGDGVASTFRPNEVISAQEINQLMIRVLGYDDVDYADVNAKAKELGVEVTSVDSDKVMRGEAFKAIRMVLDATAKDATMTLGSALELPTYEAPVVVGEVLVADAATATGLKEVTVMFNMKVTAAKAGAKTSYTVTSNTVEAVTLSEDMMSATLTLGTAIAQQGKITVKVLKAAGVAADTTLEALNVIDTTIPVAQKIELTGPKTMDITFSEPVQATSAASVVINNGLYGVSSAVLSTDSRTLTITIAAALNDATAYEVKVSGYTDFADFKALAKTFTLTYVKNTTAPVAVLTSASQTEVVITFDKAVTKADGTDLDAAYFYHTYTAWMPVMVSNVGDKVFTLSFKDADTATVDYYLPEGNSTVHVLATDGTNKVKDAWGNEFAGATFTATVTSDTAAPMVTKVEATKENQLTITFDEAVTTVVGNYTIKDSAAKAAATGTITPTYDAKVMTLDFTNKLAGGTYTVEIKGVKDTSLAANAMATTTLEFVVTDKTPATVTAKVVETLSDDKAEYIYLTFSENMDTTTTLNAANYQLDGAALPTGSTVVAFMGTLDQVKITVPSQTTTLVGSTRLIVGQVADVAGNKIVKLATAVVIGADTAPTLDKVKSLALNKVELTFTGLLDAATVTTSGMTIETSGGAVTLASIASVTTTATKTTVVAYLQADEVLANSADVVDAAAFVAGAWKSQTAKSAVLGTVVYADGIAPSYKSEVQTTQQTFTLTFDEALDATVSVDFAATDLVVTKADGTLLVAGNDYSVVVSGMTVVVSLLGDAQITADEKITVATIAAPVYLSDSVNTINAFTAKTVEMEF